ncbi:MAG: hypothetical protein LBJ35_05215, partial [Spirochaetaceae bacterium]|nr:hypothetical protein [Spirochaetaceae bacterium]
MRSAPAYRKPFSLRAFVPIKAIGIRDCQPSTTHGVESLTGGVEFAPRARQRVSIRYAAAYRESPTQQG